MDERKNYWSYILPVVVMMVVVVAVIMAVVGTTDGDSGDSRSP